MANVYCFKATPAIGGLIQPRTEPLVLPTLAGRRAAVAVVAGGGGNNNNNNSDDDNISSGHCQLSARAESIQISCTLHSLLLACIAHKIEPSSRRLPFDSIEQPFAHIAPLKHAHPQEITKTTTATTTAHHTVFGP
jgi:hypothetical protein